jgi:outer membrane protein OmpA-like peptidoglycan-associated protein
MIGIKTARRKAGKDEAEKPFWISFADLMTALMVLFLVAMAAALITVTRGLAGTEVEQKKRKAEIAGCMADVSALTRRMEFTGIVVRDADTSIDFGTLVQFADNSHALNSFTDEYLIRRFVSRVLGVARSEQCDKWLKRVVVEGFASRTGDYLYNLNLSYLRSQRVLCVLLDSKAMDAIPIEDRKLVQSLFLVGGSSFNTADGDATRMRRVELKLEFRELNREREQRVEIPLDPGLGCPNDRR